MAQRSRVPKFGNWENEDNVPYTVYFDKARKDRTTGGKIINPNDPQENPDMFQVPAPAPAPVPVRREPAEPVVGRRPVRPVHERRLSKEDSDPKQYAASPARGGPAQQRRGGGAGGAQGSGSGRPVRQSAGSEQSIERSPLHPHYRGGRGGASPAPEGRNSYDSSHGTPGRPRMKPNRGDESPDKAAAVPRFGDWDENNPSSADNYTHIFNKVREARHNPGSPQISMDNPTYYNTGKQNGDGNRKPGCFSCSIL